MTHPKTSDIPFRVLRTAVDRVTFLISRAMDENVFKSLEVEEELCLRVNGGDIVLQRRGHATAGAPQCVWGGDGVYVALRRDAAVKKGVYPVRIECQGLLCSTAKDGLAPCEVVRAQLVALLYPGLADVIDEETWPGRFDVCVDLELQIDAGLGSQWIEQVLFGAGNVDAATASWKTRASKASRKQVQERFEGTPPETPAAPRIVPARLQGTAINGRTQYYGRDPQLRVYEKDRESLKGRDGPLVRHRWIEAGWKGTTRVFRVEWEVTREWIAAQTIYTLASGEGIKLSLLQWSAFRDLFGFVCLRLASRYTHIDLTTSDRRDRCETSAWWQTACRAIRDWDLSLGDWFGLGELKHTQRRKHREKAERKVVIGLTDLQLYYPDKTFEQIAAEIGRAQDALGPLPDDLVAAGLDPGDASRPEDLARGRKHKLKLEAIPAEHREYVKRQRRQERLARRLGLALPKPRRTP